MRTSVALESIHRLIQGKHHNPFELLGPHVVDDSGRRALAVRAFLPQSAQAWVVDPGHGEAARPMRRIHPAGLFEAICPLSGPRRERPDTCCVWQTREERKPRCTIRTPFRTC